jgi:hypothetical protein
VDTPFGVSWADLGLAALQAFFDRAERDEGLTWEAKAGDIRPQHVHKAASGFGNSVMGGYLVLGATWDRQAGVWTLPGVMLNPEPKTWTSSVVTSGVNPVPPFDARVFGLSSGASVTVVRFDPVPDPPCITVEGRVFERTVGQTLPVTDPQALARLFARGERARSRAEEAARSAARLAFGSPPGMSSPALYSLAIAPIGLPPDVGYAIFRRSFVQGLWRVLDETMRGTIGLNAYTFEEVRQELVAGWLQWTTGGPGPVVLVMRQGAAAVALAGTGQGNGVAALYGDNLRGPWTAALRVAQMMGGFGPAFLGLQVQLPTGATGEVERWITLDPPTDAELASLQRELQRLRGGPLAYEPEVL